MHSYIYYFSNTKYEGEAETTTEGINVSKVFNKILQK